MRILDETKENKYTLAIAEVEESMRDNNVHISYIGGFFAISIHGKEFTLKSSEFPRLFEEENLIISED